MEYNRQDFRRLSEIAVGPHGQIGYVTLTNHELDEICIYDFDTEIQRISVKSPHNIGWNPKGKLCFLSPGPIITSDEIKHESTNQSNRPQLWVFDGDTDIVQRTAVPPGVLSYDWEPDGTRVVLECITSKEKSFPFPQSTVKTERQYHKFTGKGWFDTVGRALFIQNQDRSLISLPSTELSGALGPISGLQPAWGIPGIAFVTNTAGDERSLTTDIVLTDPDNTVSRQITTGSYSVDNPIWCPAGKKLTAIRTDLTDPLAPRDVIVEDYKNESTTVLTDDFNSHILAQELSWDHNGHIYMLAGKQGQTNLYQISVENKSIKEMFDLSTICGTLRDFDVHCGSGWCLRSSIEDGEGLAYIDLEWKDKAKNPITDSMITYVSEWDSVNEIEVEEVNWESKDGTHIAGYLYKPDASTPYELIASIHGGPTDYAEPAFSQEIIRWVKQGFAVFEPNYRGSVSFGVEFASDLQGRWNNIEIQDILSGIDHLVANNIADDLHLYVKGFSHGGTIVAYLLAASDRFRAAVAGNAIYDFRSAYGAGEAPYRFEAEFGLPWEHKTEYSRISPVDQVDMISTPLLLLAGGQDWHAPFTQADQFFTRLKRCEVDSRLVIEPDCTHEVPSSCISEMEDWFRRFGSKVLG